MYPSDTWTWRDEINWWRGLLTTPGKLEYFYYKLRKLLIAPAPSEQRCIMGSPVADSVHCPRYLATDLWCKRHQP